MESVLDKISLSIGCPDDDISFVCVAGRICQVKASTIDHSSHIGGTVALDRVNEVFDPFIILEIFVKADSLRVSTFKHLTIRHPTGGRIHPSHVDEVPGSGEWCGRIGRSGQHPDSHPDIVGGRQPGGRNSEGRAHVEDVSAAVNGNAGLNSEGGRVDREINVGSHRTQDVPDNGRAVVIHCCHPANFTDNADTALSAVGMDHHGDVVILISVTDENPCTHVAGRGHRSTIHEEIRRFHFRVHSERSGIYIHIHPKLEAIELGIGSVQCRSGGNALHRKLGDSTTQQEGIFKITGLVIIPRSLGQVVAVCHQAGKAKTEEGSGDSFSVVDGEPVVNWQVLRCTVVWINRERIVGVEPAVVVVIRVGEVGDEVAVVVAWLGSLRAGVGSVGDFVGIGEAVAVFIHVGVVGTGTIERSEVIRLKAHDLSGAVQRNPDGSGEFFIVALGSNVQRVICKAGEQNIFGNVGIAGSIELVAVHVVVEGHSQDIALHGAAKVGGRVFGNPVDRRSDHVERLVVRVIGINVHHFDGVGQRRIYRRIGEVCGQVVGTSEVPDAIHFLISEHASFQGVSAGRVWVTAIVAGAADEVQAVAMATGAGFINFVGHIITDRRVGRASPF